MNIQGGGSANETGSAQVHMAFLATYNLAWSQGPGTILFQNAPYTLRMSLTDTKSSATGILNFSGVFNGIADEASHNSTMTTTFNSPSTQSLVLGSNRYTVSLTPHPLLHWAPQPDNPVNKFFGTIDAEVNVSPAGGTSTPEPSCVALAGMGLITVFGAAWRNRRRA
jgi:hypothetical protein